MQRFLAAQNPEQALGLVGEAPDGLLTDEALAKIDRLAAAEPVAQQIDFQ